MPLSPKKISLKDACEALQLNYENFIALLKDHDSDDPVSASGAGIDDLTDLEENAIRRNIHRANESWLITSILGRLDMDDLKFEGDITSKDARILDNIAASSGKSERRLLGEILRGAQSKVKDGLENEFKRRIKGQDELVHSLLIALVLNEHCLLEGLPGVGKTEIVKWIANVTGLPFSRVQFIPDMLPSDLIGKDHIDILKLNARDPNAISWANGPIFTSILLADEINRAPSKVQAALLESMGEKQVTPFGKMSMPVLSPLHQAALELWPLKFPELFSKAKAEPRGLIGMPVIPAHRKDLAQFTVFATMNPIEQEGTYPLSEAQTDRFCFKVIVPYPPRDSYLDILEVVYSGEKPPEAVELNLSVLKCRRYFEKYPRHMIPVLLPLYFLLKCRAEILPVRIGKDEWMRDRPSKKSGGSSADDLVVSDPLFFTVAEDLAGKSPDLRMSRTESDILQKIHDVVYTTNARTIGAGETQGARLWYDKEQIEMRQYIFEQERSGRDTKRKERLSRILEEEHCQYVKAGGSPRAFLKLVAASLCQAFLDSRDKIDEEDVIKVIDNVLRHRIHMDVHARMAGISPEDVIHRVCERILSPDNR